MTPRPLHELRLRARDHKHALWWLALLYRKPRLFHQALQAGTRAQQFGVGLRLEVHALPYVVLLCVLGRVLLFGVFGLPTRPSTTTLDALLRFHLAEIAGAIAIGIAVGDRRRDRQGDCRGDRPGDRLGIAFGSP